MNSWGAPSGNNNSGTMNGADEISSDQYPLLGRASQPASQQAQQSVQPPQQQQQQPSATAAFLPPGLAPSSRPNTPIINLNTNNSNNNNNNSSTVDNVDENQISDIDKFGLKGLLSTIKMENIEQTKFTIGTDLNMLGLNFLDEGKLSASFETPWPEIIRTELEPSFRFDPRFRDIELLNLSDDKFSSLSDETLFFIFYTKPNHYYQELASKQLNNRNWRFHKDLQLWLTKDSNVEPIQQNNQSERGIYIFFDPSSWEKVKKEFVLQYASLHQVI